jgi:hypothetical protein
VAESRLALGTLPDDELAQALRDLAMSIAFPSTSPAGAGAPDLAERVRLRIELNPPRPSIWRRLSWGLGLERRSPLFGGRPLRRGLVLALVAVLVLAAVAGAVGLGLPGLRIIFGQGPTPGSASPSQGSSPATSQGTSPSASISPLGASIGLGTALPLAEVERLAGFAVLMPTNPDLGPPDATYIDNERVTLVWTSRAGLPDTEEPGIGLVLSEFRGQMFDGYFQKILGSGTVLTQATVDGSNGFWLSGAPHFFMYVDPAGKIVNDDRRIVGDTLIWTKEELTFRLETSLGKTEAIRIAESLR